MNIYCPLIVYGKNIIYLQEKKNDTKKNKKNKKIYKKHLEIITLKVSGYSDAERWTASRLALITLLRLINLPNKAALLCILR